jgi:hypothetical protein
MMKNQKGDFFLHSTGAKQYDHYPIKYGTWWATPGGQIVLLWDQCKYSSSIPVEPNKTNVGLMHSASDAKSTTNPTSALEGHQAVTCKVLGRKRKKKQLVGPSP